MTLARSVGPTLIVLVAMTLAACGQSGGSSERTAASAASPAATRYEDHVSAGGLLPPGEEPHNPHAGNKESAGDGEKLFASMNCDGCHGGGGSGWVGPSLADGRWRYGGRDEEVFNSIFYGRPKGMPAYGGAVGADGVWLLVTYLKSLPVPEGIATQSWIEDSTSSAAEAPPAVAASDRPAAGATLETALQDNGCTACHAVNRPIIGPAFAAVAKKYGGQPSAEEKLVASVKNGSVGHWGDVPMPPNTSISEAQARGIVKQIVALK